MQDCLDSRQVHAQVWPPPPQRQGTLASSPQGSYTYDSSHDHAVDAIGSSGYEAQYDASGNMTCRTPTSAAVCTTSSQTGARFTYDVEGRLIQWVSANGSTTVSYGYDGEGQRFEMQVTSGSTTTTTTYLSNLEESTSVNGGAAAVTGYFSFGAQRLGEYQNSSGAWYDLLSDSLSSTTVVVNSLGVVAAQLFAPDGQRRWVGGTMPTSYAFTGQRADSTTGLDYYGARYYDPAVGVFTSADMASGKGAGLNCYAYVSGNPETLTDPTGHLINRPCLDGEWCGGGPGGPGGTVGGGKCPDRQSGCSGSGSGGGHGPQGTGGDGDSSGSAGGTCRTDASCDMDGDGSGGGGNGNGWRPCGPVQDFCITGDEDSNNAILSLGGFITNQLTAQGADGIEQLIAYLQSILGGWLSGYLDAIYNQELAQIAAAGGGGSVVAGGLAAIIGTVICGPWWGLAAGATVFGAGAAATGLYALIIPPADKANAAIQISGQLEDAITTLKTLEDKIVNGALDPNTVVTLNEEDFGQSDTLYPQVDLWVHMVGPNTPPEAGGVESPYSGY